MCGTISRVPRRSAVSIVFLAGLAILGWKAGGPGIATAYVDPLARIQAQDEAYYGAISIHIAEHGDWLTPRFLDRYALAKPPLLMWCEAAAVKVMGRGAWALRLPSIVAGAGTLALVFWWLLEEGVALAAALTAVLLLLSSHLFFVLSRIGLTDAILMFTTTLAMFALARDPRLASRAGLWTFGLASGAAILTKGLAGLFALLALALFCVISKEHPHWRRVAQVVAISAGVAAPWHLYQLWRHTRWFWAEYVVTELVTNSVGKPPQSTEESQVGYYLRRLLALDAPLLVAALVALARVRSRVLIAWIVVVLAAALSFEYRNTTYLLPVFPALALLVGRAIPSRWAVGVLALAALLFAGKVVASAEPWGLPFGPQSVIAMEPMLDRYAALQRGNELVIVSPDDGFYSACLDLPRVRYLYLDPSTERRKYALDFEYLGVTVTASDFERLPELRPQFKQRLFEWGLQTGDPVATVILAQNQEQIDAIVRDHPNVDFILPDAGGGHHLLLSREVIQRAK
jgi:4-amino-4-deoxy-L-arabinose transferase-like glycosyltransferase